jgi:GTP cyclohydrolase IA
VTVDVKKTATTVVDLLVALGVPQDPHTDDTPGRVARAWRERLAGYDVDPGRHLERTFPGPADAGLVIVAGLRLVTTCAHHLLPIVGSATVAYRPAVGARVVGLSKLARVLADYAARLQVQEQLGAQVAATIGGRLAPVGAGCVITAAHGCMSVRGVLQAGAVTTTSSWVGGWDERHPDVVAVLAEHHAARGVFPAV